MLPGSIPGTLSCLLSDAMMGPKVGVRIPLSATVVCRLPEVRPGVVLFWGVIAATIAVAIQPSFSFDLALFLSLALAVLHEIGVNRRKPAPSAQPIITRSLDSPDWSPPKRSERSGSRHGYREDEKMPIVPANPSLIQKQLAEMSAACSPPQSDLAIVFQLCKAAEKQIALIVPEAQINATPAGNLAKMAAMGWKSDVTMIIQVDPQTLAYRLAEYFSRGNSRTPKSMDKLKPDMLQKTATKFFGERLKFARFWRSQLGGNDPMVILVIDPSQGFAEFPIRLSLCINNICLLRMCTMTYREELNTKQLLFIVTRWIQERGLINVSRGLPHVYAWTLIVLLYLRTARARTKTLLDLFQGFIRSCAFQFDISDGQCVQFMWSGKRSHFQDTAMYVEDPFDDASNVAQLVTPVGLARAMEEIERAGQLLAREDVSIDEVLERWTPVGVTADAPVCTRVSRPAVECPGL